MLQVVGEAQKILSAKVSESWWAWLREHYSTTPAPSEGTVPLRL